MAISIQIITGFLGSGKTSLVRHLIEGPAAGRVGVVVGEYAEDGFDGQMIQASGATVRQITSTGRGISAASYLPPARSFVEEGRFDRIIVETSGVTEIAHVSQDLANDPEVGKRAIFGPTIVVVDASSFESHDRHFPAQFWSQIDVADIVAVNKTDKVGSEVLEMIRQRVKNRNPEANVQFAFMGQLNRIIASTLPVEGFIPRAMRASWEGVLPGEFESFVYRSHRPCYDRVAFGHLMLNLPGGQIARYKGVLRSWDRAYCINGMPGQLDWDNTPVDGDTRIAFIGLGMEGRREEITSQLDKELERQRDAMRAGDL